MPKTNTIRRAKLNTDKLPRRAESMIGRWINVHSATSYRSQQSKHRPPSSCRSALLTSPCSRAANIPSGQAMNIIVRHRSPSIAKHFRTLSANSRVSGETFILEYDSSASSRHRTTTKESPATLNLQLVTAKPAPASAATDFARLAYVRSNNCFLSTASPDSLSSLGMKGIGTPLILFPGDAGSHSNFEFRKRSNCTFFQYLIHPTLPAWRALVHPGSRLDLVVISSGSRLWTHASGKPL